MLNLVPMAALVDEQDQYLALRFEISYVTSGRDLLRFDSKAIAHGPSVIVADPEFGNDTHLIAQTGPATKGQRSVDLDRGGLVFRPLPNTALEAQDIMKLLTLSTSRMLLREEATEANLKELHGPRVLHLASHGFFLSDHELTAELRKRSPQTGAPSISENPLLRSGIALSGANARRSGENDDGILTALEVAQLDLHGTELVVLSACDSGVGDVQNGEGVYGLRRALVLAGAQTQVTSLWKVSDEATRTLMIDYYQRLLKGEGRSVALLHAQQSMMANPSFSHPYYWASFIPLGNWLPLATRH
jgi:CHAT domain-containing protein